MSRQLPSAVVCGAGGFIGGHLVRGLQAMGVRVVRAVDIKPVQQWFQVLEGVENLSLDLKERDACKWAVQGVDRVYQLAADMGGMGFIESHKAACMLNVLTSTQVLRAAQEAGVNRFFYASSACVYSAEKQRAPGGMALREEDAYPAQPEDGYGWEKLFSERMCRHFQEDFGMMCRVARYHNVYGPHGTWRGGREKAPAAICRKVLEAKLSGDHRIRIWGDGQQTRSFMFIDDCVKGTELIMNSDIGEPINLGSSEAVSIDELVSIAEEIAGVRLQRIYELHAPRGVNGRNSDNTMIRRRLGWEPSVRLVDGMTETMRWIEGEMLRSRSHAGSERVLDVLAPLRETCHAQSEREIRYIPAI